MMTRLAAVALSLFIVLLVVELVRQERLTFKYAAGWLVVGVLGVLFSILDGWLWRLSEIFGFELMSNFVFFALIGFLLLTTLIMTLFLCQQNRRNDIIAQKIGMLEYELRSLRGARETSGDLPGKDEL